MIPNQATSARARKNLIFDADDTLWENNVYFIEATEAFLDVMEAGRLDREEARRRLTEAERGFVAHHGYGTAGFTACLVSTARELLPEISRESIDHVESLGRAILERDALELLPGVEQALRRLTDHDRLFLLTKGDDREQREKLARSQLAPYFEHVEVVREKDVNAYRALVDRLGLDPKWTWMIGNSPKSDINPALAAGLNAVLIPHPQTWEMELEEIENPQSERLRVVESVSELISLFTSEEKE
jgi:putative hydrolase of the HAD superfamily